MTITDVGPVTAETQVNPVRPSELPIEDRPDCPACGAGAEYQATIARVPDGALELAIMVCTKCAKDHPSWL